MNAPAIPRLPDMSLHFLVVNDDGTWVAHCLDFDIAAQGEREDEAVQNLIQAIELVIEQAVEDGNQECLFQSAPQRLWDMFVKTPPQSKRPRKIRLSIRKPQGTGTKKPEVRFEERICAYA